MRFLQNRFSLLLFLASIGLGGLLWAGPSSVPQQQAPVTSYPPHLNNMQAVPQQAVQGAHRRGGSGSVTRLKVGHLKAIRIKTPDGRTGWRVDIPGRRALATPAVVDGMVFVGGGFGSHEFYAFDAKTGKALWAIKVSDDGPTAAVVAEGVVAFNTESCTLFVVDAKTGRQLWGKWLGDPLMSQPAIAAGRIYMAYPGDGGHKLIAMQLKTGKKIWEAPIAGDAISAPVVDGEAVYVATFDGTVYKFASQTGKLAWKEGYRATSAPWLHAEQVYVSQREPGQAMPKEGIGRMAGGTGKSNQAGGSWRQRAAPYLNADVQAKSAYHAAQKADDSSVGFSSGPSTAKLGAASANVGQGTVRGLWEFQGSRPCVANNRLFLTQGGELVAMDPDSGKELWSRKLKGDLNKLGGHLAAPPSPAGGKLYLATLTGKVLVLSQATGKQLAILDLKAPLRFQPALANGRMFVGSTNGSLIAIDLADKTADGWPMWGGGPTHNGA